MPQMFLGIGLALGVGNTKAPIVNAPVNVTPPTVAGAVTVGSTLTATPGTWTGTAPITYAYQWERNGVDIPGATGLTHVVDIADEGTVLQIKETATNTAGSDFQYSFPVDIPVPGQFGFGPRVMSLPVISYSADMRKLDATDGVWDAQPPAVISFTWLKNGVIQPGKTVRHYTLTSNDEGAVIRARVQATNASGTAVVLSNPIIAHVTR